MNEHITQEQLNELRSINGQAFPTQHLLTIGEMINYIDEHITAGWWQIQRESKKELWRLDAKYIDFECYEEPELCDALWKAMKMLMEIEAEQL